MQPLWKTVWKLLKWLNIELPYDPALSSPREMKTHVYTKMCIGKFIAALFVK